MQGSFRRGRRRCDRAGTETWQGKLLIQPCLFLKTSKGVFRFCFKVPSWEVSVAAQALCSCRGMDPGWAHSWALEAELSKAAPGSWKHGMNSLLPPAEAELVQFPPALAPHCPCDSARGELLRTLQLSREVKAGAWSLLHREPVACWILLVLEV